MGGNGKQKKSSGSPFGVFNFFKGKGLRPRKVEDDYTIVRAYKVWPSDEDRGHYVAEPGIDWLASAYIAGRTERWNAADIST